MPRFLIVAALLAAVLSSPAEARHRPAMRAAAAQARLTQAIEAQVKKQTALLMKKDAAGLAALFTKDAVYATASGEVFSGRDKIKDYYAHTIPALGGEFTRESAADEVHMLGDYAWALGHGRTVVQTPAGVAELKDHWLAIYTEVGGEWKIRVLNLGENVALMPVKY